MPPDGGKAGYGPVTYGLQANALIAFHDPYVTSGHRWRLGEIKVIPLDK